MTEQEQERLFPFHPASRRQISDMPKGIPWEIAAAHEAQALANHGQSLETLAHRHGMCASEMLDILTDKPWAYSHRRGVSEEEAFEKVMAIVKEQIDE